MPITWRREDTEAVPCCLCGREGRPIHDLDPLGVVRCPHCTLVFVSPRLRPEALQRLYDEPGYHAGVYGPPGRLAPAMFLQRTWTRGRLALLARERGTPAGGARLLEIGAGHGLFLAAARDQGYDVTGIELSATAAAYARDRLGLTVHATQLEDAPLDGAFDVICAWDTIEHVPDPVGLWTQIERWLAPGGVVLFSTPNVSSLPARLLRGRWWTLKPIEHIWHFSPRTHRLAAGRAGLAITRFVRSPVAAPNRYRFDSLVGVAHRDAGK